MAIETYCKASGCKWLDFALEGFGARLRGRGHHVHPQPSTAIENYTSHGHAPVLFWCLLMFVIYKRWWWFVCSCLCTNINKQGIQVSNGLRLNSVLTIHFTQTISAVPRCHRFGPSSLCHLLCNLQCSQFWGKLICRHIENCWFTSNFFKPITVST